MRSGWQRLGLGGGAGAVLGAGSGATFAAAVCGGRSVGAAAVGTGRRQTGYGKKREESGPFLFSSRLGCGAPVCVGTRTESRNRLPVRDWLPCWPRAAGDSDP